MTTVTVTVAESGAAPESWLVGGPQAPWFPSAAVSDRTLVRLPVTEEHEEYSGRAPTTASAIRTLAQYRPFENGGAGLRAAHDDLVSAALAGHGGSFASLELCRLFIIEKFKIELELDEVRDSRGRLADRGDVTVHGGALALTNGRREVMIAERRAWEAAEAQAMVEWETAVRRVYPQLSTEDVDDLRAQIRPWLDRVLILHGAESGLLLHPGSASCERLVKSMGSVNLSFLPACHRDGLERFRAGAFRLLVRIPTDAQREFLSRLLNTAFYSTVLSIDPRAGDLASAELSKVTLYLDTNFLYSVLGVGGSAAAHAASRFIELCKELGVSPRISPWTADELRTSIASSKRDVGKFEQTQTSAKVMASVTGEKGFVPAYWRAARDENADAETFFGKFTHFQLFLDDLGIQEHAEAVPIIEADLEAIRDHASPLEGMYGPGTKERTVIEHDAKMRMLIEHLRNENGGGPGLTGVRYWFITESTKLPTYARIPVGEYPRPEFPFCILASSWAQLMRAMVPRTRDLDEMLVGLFDSPYVGHRPPLPQTSQVALERIMARINQLNNVPAPVAIAMANDAALAAQIGSEIDQVVVNQLIDEAVDAKAKQLEDQIAKNAEDAAATRQKLVEAQAEVVAASTRVEELERELAWQRDESLAVTHAATEQVSQSTSRVEELKEEVEQQRTRADVASSRLTLVTRLAGLGAAVLSGGVGATLIGTDVVTGLVGVSLTVVAVTVVAYVVLRLAWRTAAAELLNLLSLIASAVALVGLAFTGHGSHAAHLGHHPAATLSTPGRSSPQP